MHTQDLEKTAKLIGDLDSLVCAVLASAPTARPGQRQLRADLVAADTALQVLRMAIAMDRPVYELVQASGKLRDSLRLAHVHAANARVDQPTRQAVQLAGRLAQEVLRYLSASAPAVGPGSEL